MNNVNTFNIIKLNTNKKKGLLFIHGFNTNAAFWIDYLDYFKDFQLILLNLNYNNCENLSYLKDKIILEQEKNGLQIIAIISHSLGTFFSNYFSLNISIKQFDICPIAFSKKFNKKEFIKFISTKTNQSQSEVFQNIAIIKNKNIYKYITPNIKNKLLLIPSFDQYFTYTTTNYPQLFFNGDHFQIHNAIKEILLQLNLL